LGQADLVLLTGGSAGAVGAFANFVRERRREGKGREKERARKKRK